MAPDARSRLIVNADDFGRSHSINQAIIYAHREGILTTASLMVTGEAFREAAALARLNPKLGVGLHLTLVHGQSALPPREIPGLVTAESSFSNSAVATGMKYFFRTSLANQLEREIAAQFNKFRETGLVMDHLNGHLNLHLHPTVFRILMRHAEEWRIDALRLTHDPLMPNLRMARGRWSYRLSHALVFNLLSRRARPALERRQIRHATAVFGLLQNGRVTEDYLLKLLASLPDGVSEIYSHPCVEKFKLELAALISPKARPLLRENRIELIRYQDLI